MKFEDPFTKFVLAVLVSLVVAGVLGAFNMSAALTRLDERVTNWLKTSTDVQVQVGIRMDGLARDQRDSDRRIGEVERRLPNTPPR